MDMKDVWDNNGSKNRKGLSSVKNLFVLLSLIICLTRTDTLHAEDPQIFDVPVLDTTFLGGVKNVTPQDLVEMQNGQYILHARDGVLSKIPAEKYVMPRDPRDHGQRVNLAIGPDGSCYVMQASIMSKSIDGGRSWTTYAHYHPQFQRDNLIEREILQIQKDGTFVSLMMSEKLEVLTSSDEGRTWKIIARIEMPPEYPERYIFGLFRVPDDTLITAVGVRNIVAEEDWKKLISGKHTLILHRSQDKGKTWLGPFTLYDWSHEGGIAPLPSGKLLAVLRYQRPALPGDPPDLHERTNAGQKNKRLPYKHVFLADSDDVGQTWKNMRQLTTAYGQCFGYPAVLRDGTIVVVHDHRYEPGIPCGRAMISFDEGQIWEDETYYLYYGKSVSGFNQSVTLPDDVILTLAGTSDYPDAQKEWHASIGQTDMTVSRWKPVKKNKQRKTLSFMKRS